MKYYGHLKRDKLDFSYHLADHCNLNCKGCDNYSPIAKPKFTDIKVFERDIKRIRELFGTNVKAIGLLGGEPLLHPDICDFFYAARNAFPEAEIPVYIITNGILLGEMSEEFWTKCRELNIEIRYTRYPIGIDYDSFETFGNEKGVSVVEFGHKDVKEKSLEFLPFDLSGRQDIENNFKKCFHANRCIQVFDGYIYTCNIRAYIDTFMEKYGVAMEKSEADRIYMYDDVSAEDILSFLSEPIPFCRYCNIDRRSDGHVWRVANKAPEIYDWLPLSLGGIDQEFTSRFDSVYLLINDVEHPLYDEAVRISKLHHLDIRFMIGDIICSVREIVSKERKTENVGVIIHGFLSQFIESEHILVENGIRNIYRLFE